MLNIYCWAWGLSLSMVNIPSETMLVKINFSFTSKRQLQIASWLGMEGMSTSQFQHWDCIWIEPVQVSCLLPQAPRVHMCISSDVSRRHFLRLFHPTPLLGVLPRGLGVGREVDKDTDECSKLFHALRTVQLLVSMLLLMTSRGE